MKTKIEPNIFKNGRKYLVCVMRKGCDFSTSFNSLDEARQYLSHVKSIEHGSREWQQDSVKYKGQSYILLRRNDQIHSILVDSELVEELMKINWCITKNGYAFGFSNGHKLFMHQYIKPNQKQGYVVNHINHNRLDNRRENLEIITHAENIKKGYQNKKMKSNNRGGI